MVLLSSLTLWLTGCDSVPVRTESVTVNVPVYIRLPKELTAPVVKPVLPAGPVTVEDVLGLADARGAAIDAANGQLQAIEALQPKEQ